MKDIEHAYAYCHNIISQHSKTFTKAFGSLPKKKRQAVWAIYAFCREVDDIVDEQPSSMTSLENFETEFAAFLDGDLPAGDPKWLALHDVFSTFDMNPQPFHEMIQGQYMDLHQQRYETLEELENYAYHVASTVGLMLLPVLAPTTHQRLQRDGIALGKAMQLTNILRDVGEDLSMGRIYLPRRLLSDYGVSEAQLLAGNVDQNFINLWECIATRAENLYQQAFTTMHLYPLNAQLPVKGAAHMYRAILDAVRKNEYDVFTKRAFIEKERKQSIMHSVQG
ncbi:phytoene/squalene synthase family protein [Shouchella shacheensis]|uniref:phytoene/squalene synthase family protein n=1 Tax=Shouchella shacheensis TaxID=1649580 RepID=UPI0007402391|nr:phytoene/squalene synthase family protein [Shouchella shacheensis]